MICKYLIFALFRAISGYFAIFSKVLKYSVKGQVQGSAMLTRGLEPPRVAPYGPEPYASASSAT